MIALLARVSWGRVAATLMVVALLAAGVWKIYHTGVVAGRTEVQTQWDSAKAKQNADDLAAEQETRKRELALQADADTLRRTKDAQITKVSHERDAALAANRLLRTPRPPEYTPAPPGTGPVCSGSGLFTQDADFLIRESARSDGLRAAYLYCEAQYNKARDAVNSGGSD